MMSVTCKSGEGLQNEGLTRHDEIVRKANKETPREAFSAIKHSNGALSITQAELVCSVACEIVVK